MSSKVDELYCTMYQVVEELFPDTVCIIHEKMLLPRSMSSLKVCRSGLALLEHAFAGGRLPSIYLPSFRPCLQS